MTPEAVTPLEMNEIEKALLRADKSRSTRVTVSSDVLRRLLGQVKSLSTSLESISAADAENDEAWDEDDYEDDDDLWMREDCERCGGDGWLELSECPELWGEDCMSEKNRAVNCPVCKGSGLVDR